MIWHCHTTAGVFWIAPYAGSHGRWRLRLGYDMPLGSYLSPMAAAEDVARQVTGWPAWDLQRDVPTPCDLSEWTLGPPP